MPYQPDFESNLHWVSWTRNSDAPAGLSAPDSYSIAIASSSASFGSDPAVFQRQQQSDSLCVATASRTEPCDPAQTNATAVTLSVVSELSLIHI